MKCPICCASDTAVRDSRATEDLAAIRRRRCCESCGFRFTTFERPELKEIWVIKKHGGEEAFDRKKIARSIKKAMHKRDISREKVDALIARVTRKLELSEEARVSTHAIGLLVLTELRAVDPVAYVRFASVYEEFQDVADFTRLIGEVAPPTEGAETS